MTKRMLVDATHPEETRVAIVDGNWLNDFDFERTSKKQLKGNIYLAKVIRIEPSLQAAFVEYGGNRHGFLPFSEIHPDYFRIPMADRPHDAPPDDDVGDDDEGEDISEGSEVDIAAHADDADHHHEHHDGDHLNHEHHEDEHMHSEEPVSFNTPAEHGALEQTSPPLTEAGSYNASPASEFASEAGNDLGLITDFGNAAISDPNLVPPPVTVETVGGEAAVEEERYRRPPRPRYKIQEVVKRRQVMLIQVVKEERGNKGAALTTFLSLAGRYCVLMPNTDHGGGVSRKITSHQDRRRMKEILDQLEIPEGMAVILRTAGMEQSPPEIQRDLEYLLRLWNNIREQTLQSTAPALIYEEANLIKRSMRDMYAPDLSEILVSGQRGHFLATEFMRTIMPDQLDKVKLYEDTVPLFFRYNVEKQIDQLYNPTVQLRSGGYIVINPTEALVSIDVNSGRATRERHIEGTALKTNLEAAEEIARQLRLRDLAGLVVIDFIDMEDGRNNSAVERRLKEAMRSDRARLQIGRISPFGLLELSRQRLHPSLMEINFEKCPHCAGLGLIRSIDSAAISILRMIEEEGIRNGAAELVLNVPTKVALYILNQKRPALSEIEARYNLQVLLHSDDELVPPDYKLERVKPNGERTPVAAVNSDQLLAGIERPPAPVYGDSEQALGDKPETEGRPNRENGGRRRRGRYGYGRNRNNQNPNQQAGAERGEQPTSDETNGNVVEAQHDGNDNIGNTIGAPNATPGNPNNQDQQRRAGRRRGRRGGRGRRPNGEQGQSGHQRRDGGGGHHQRNDQQQGNWNRGPQTPAPMAVAPVPTSIHELDTTPREARGYGAQESAPRSSSPYEVVDQASDKPKGGWWRKLTGQ
ncbi:MAG: ribonuclease E/G [Alphaproteobacteria bacterium]